MSWQPYIDEHVLEAGFHEGAIVGHGGEIWASSPEFDVSRANGRAPGRDGGRLGDDVNWRESVEDC